MVPAGIDAALPPLWYTIELRTCPFVPVPLHPPAVFPTIVQLATRAVPTMPELKATPQPVFETIKQF